MGKVYVMHFPRPSEVLAELGLIQDFSMERVLHYEMTSTSSHVF